MVRITFAFILLFLATSSFAQLRDIPKEVTEAFTAQYDKAEQVEYKDNLVFVAVNFVLNGEKMRATYTNKGVWRDTEKDWSFEQLSADVKTGFEKSKYAEWKVVEAKIVYLPGNVERYRVKVEKSDLQKKNLIFNTTGRLIEDSITL